jgi:DNA topoisomerase IB
MKSLEQKVERNEYHKPAFQLKIGDAFQHIPKKEHIDIRNQNEVQKKLVDKHKLILDGRNIVSNVH